jgi:phosphoglycolate phosphatase
MAIEKKFVLFDFDGVIIDSFGAAFGASSKIHPDLTEEIYRKLFEGNINEWEESLDKQIHSNRCNHDIDYQTEYIPRVLASPIFDGMLDVLHKLQEQYKLIIISSTVTSPIKDYLTKHNVAYYFEEIMGVDVHTKKDKKIKIVFDKYNVKEKDCVFVTDTLGDMIEADKMGVPAIGVSWGFQNHQTLKQGKPIRVVDTPSELVGAINSHFKKTL